MKSRRGSGKDTMVVRFLGPYLIILLVPLLIGMIVYDKTVKVMKEEVIHTNMTVLAQTREILDGRLHDIEMNVQQLLRNDRVNSFQHIQAPFQGANTYRIMETRKELFEYALVNRFLLDYFVVFKNSDLAMSAQTTYKLSEFYNEVLNYERMDYAQWYEQFLGTYRREYTAAEPVMYKGKPYSALTFVHTMGNAGFFNGAVIVLIDNHEIQKLLSGVNISKGGWAYIMDDQGEIISFITSDQEVKGTIPIPGESKQGTLEPTEETGRMLVTYTTSSYNGWTYVAVQPPHIVLEKVNYIHKYAFIMLLIMLAAGMGIAFFLAYRSSRPIRKLLQMITERMEGKKQSAKDTFGFIQQSFSELYHHNEALNAKIKQQLPIIRAAFFERLLRGEFNSAADVEASMKHVGIAMDGPGYSVVLIYLRGYQDVINPDILEELDIKRIMVTEIFKAVFAESGFLHDTGDDKIAMIVSLPSPDIQEGIKALKSRMAQVDSEMLRKQGIWATCGVGRVYTSPLEIVSAYEDAQYALNGRHRYDNAFALYYSELAVENSSFYYPGEVETRLMNYAKAGDRLSAEQLLSELYRENMERRLSTNMLKLWFNGLWGTIVKLMDHLDGPLDIAGEDGYTYVQAMISRVHDLDDTEEMLQAIKLVLMRMCDAVDSRKKSHNDQLKADVLNMLETEFVHPDFCLDMVADRFQMSAKYLSQFFKEQTGVNFSDYLNTLRMEEAKKLLQSTDLSMNEITLKIGYNSLNVFSRAFKRSSGMSPTVYRRSVRE